MKTFLIILLSVISTGVFAQKSVFNGTWHSGADKETGLAFSVNLKVKDGEVKRGTVAAISMKDSRGENYKLESAELRGDTAIISFSHKKYGNYKGRMIYHADEKAMYWILDEFDKERDIVPTEMKMSGKHY